MCRHYQNGNEDLCTLCLSEKKTRYHEALRKIVRRIREIGDDAPAELVYDLYGIATAALGTKPVGPTSKTPEPSN